MAAQGTSAPTLGSMQDHTLTMVSTRQRAHSQKTVATQTQGLPRDVAAQASGFREGLNLLLLGEGRVRLSDLRWKVCSP